MSTPATLSDLQDHGEFARRHIGPDAAQLETMLAAIGVADLDELIDRAVPDAIRVHEPLGRPAGRTERDVLTELRAVAQRNEVMTALIGMGYHGTITPPVIQRNVLENPAWYTAYTPYQPEIAQGRLEALINFQTAVCDLTGMEIANASMLDEGTAAAEAVTLCHAVSAVNDGNLVLVDADTHPQTIGVIRTRAEPLDVQVVVAGPAELLARAAAPKEGERPFVIVLSNPGSSGAVRSIRADIEAAHAAGLLVIVATDLLASVLLESPGAQGADVVVGNS